MRTTTPDLPYFGTSIFKPTKTMLGTFSLVNPLRKFQPSQVEVTSHKTKTNRPKASKPKHASNCNSNCVPVISMAIITQTNVWTRFCTFAAPRKFDDTTNSPFTSLSCDHVRYLLHHLERGLQNLGKEYHHEPLNNSDGLFSG